MNRFFYDTYAFIELIYANPNYLKYKNTQGISTTRFNLMELYYGLLRKENKGTAELFYNRFLPFVVEYDDETIKEAMEFKFMNKNKRLSYVDCLGYILSRRLRIPFLTGDREFEGLIGVEFVK